LDVFRVFSLLFVTGGAIAVYEFIREALRESDSLSGTTTLGAIAFSVAGHS
jgi:hypothetical protein